MTQRMGVHFGSEDEVQWRRGTLVARLTESKYYKSTFEVIDELDWSVGVPLLCRMMEKGR